MGRDTEAVDIMHNLEILDHRTPTACELMILYFKLMLPTLSIASGILGNCFVSTAGYVYINLSKDKLQQASFGITISYYLIFCAALALSVTDKFGIQLGVAFGDGKYEKMKKITFQSILSVGLLYMSFCYPMLCFSERILLSIGIAEENALLCGEALRLMIGMVTIQLTADMVKTFCISQGQESAFALPNFMNLLVCFSTMYNFMVKLDLKIRGWVYAKYIYELINLLVNISVLYCRTLKETRGISSWSEMTQGFWPFIFDTIRYSLESYSEYIGYETTYFVALLRDQDQMAAYSSVYNITGIIYCLGLSLAQVCRTRLNILIGLKRF